MHHTGDLHVDGFLSWVPRFDRPKQVRFWIGGSGLYNASRFYLTSEHLWPFRAYENPDSLKVEGVRFDAVSSTGSLLVGESVEDFSPEDVWAEISTLDIYDPPGPSSSNISSLLDLRTHLPSLQQRQPSQIYAPTSEALDVAFGLTLIGGEARRYPRRPLDARKPRLRCHQSQKTVRCWVPRSPKRNTCFVARLQPACAL